MGEGGMPIGQVQNMSATIVYVYMYILNLSTIKCIAVWLKKKMNKGNEYEGEIDK